jgi:hypothetical protein
MLRKALEQLASEGTPEKKWQATKSWLKSALRHGYLDLNRKWFKMVGMNLEDLGRLLGYSGLGRTLKFEPLKGGIDPDWLKWSKKILEDMERGIERLSKGAEKLEKSPERPKDYEGYENLVREKIPNQMTFRNEEFDKVLNAEKKSLGEYFQPWIEKLRKKLESNPTPESMLEFLKHFDKDFKKRFDDETIKETYEKTRPDLNYLRSIGIDPSF